MHRFAAIPVALWISIAGARGQTPQNGESPTAVSELLQDPAADDEPIWSFSASVYTYFVPDDRDYVVPTITADRDWLHLELRYNYEGLDTVSFWAGYNFSVGSEWTLEFTPMLGGVFGDTDGVAPGYKGSLGWRQFELYSEGEYLIDANDASSSYFYSWTELTFAPVDSFRFGLVAQRTKLYDSDREIQRGLLAGYSGESWDLTGQLFDPDEPKPTFVLAFAVSF